MTRIRLATHNLQARMRLRDTLHDTSALLAEGPHVVGWQEIGGVHRWLAMAAVCVSHGLRPSGVRLLDQPTAWRRDRLKRVQRIRWELSPETKVRKRGAGPRRLRQKHATGGVYKVRKTGDLVAVVDVHLAPSVRYPERDRLHRQQVERLCALVEHLRHIYPAVTIAIGGDWNTTDRDRLLPLIRLGLLPGPEVPTHGRHAIDRWLTDGKARGHRTIRSRSDHRPLIVDLEV